MVAGTWKELRSCTTELSRSQWGTEQWLRKTRAGDPGEQSGQAEYLHDRTRGTQPATPAREHELEDVAWLLAADRGHMDTRDRMISD